MIYLKTLSCFLLFVYANLTESIDKLIYQKDVSEHCRRRVYPSIFLGRQVMGANSRILQFSRLELPYSCYISIRTESGSNMVMTIQLASDDLRKSCSKNSEQLLVYEIGETFGGYWGPIPDTMLKTSPVKHKIYTLKHTQPPTTTTTTRTTEPTEKLSFEPQEFSTTPKKSSDYIDVEIPIVNVSVKLMSGEMQPPKPLDKELAFDMSVDVTPIPGVSYDTSIMPLVQFSIREEPGRRFGNDEPPKYALDIVEEFTPDIRLTLPPYNPTKHKKRKSYRQRYQATRRLNFKKHKKFIDAEINLNRQIVPRVFTKYEFPSRIPITHKKTTQAYDSWVELVDLMRKLNKTSEHTQFKTTTISENKINNIEQIVYKVNKSAYLLTNLFSHDKNTIREWNPSTLADASITRYNNEKLIMSTLSTSNELKNITTKTLPENIELQNEEKYAKNTKMDITQSLELQFQSNTFSDPNEYDTLAEGATRTTVTKLDIQDDIFKKLGNKDNIVSRKDQSVVSGSMVGHESWENVVQAAPEMAIKLNQTLSYDIAANTSDDIPTDLNDSRQADKLLIRKKKNIHSISIENARPHNLTTKVANTTTTKSSFEIADMQEFAQLVELHDNELHGRVALRHLRRYVGPTLYNLCDLAESTKRHVHLFNSSRIILSISNFTLDRMIIILTAARTLLSGETRCPKAQLECQVSGARVCLDSMVACDGVPNCGSYDIYDEDRLLCGASVGLQHNVYLAAFTFLAVLLTTLYAVHYWLKRCVPKVADAFFVYIDGVENVLYLDSIMRSPNDTDDLSKMVYQSSFFGDENIYEDLSISNTNICTRFFKRLCYCFRKKQVKCIEEINAKESTEMETITQMQQRRLYSITDLDIPKTFTLSKDNSVQTGESLEMKYLENVKLKGNVETSTAKEHLKKAGLLAPSVHATSSPTMITDSMLTLEEPLPEKHLDELSLIKFYKSERRTNSLESEADKAPFNRTNTRDARSDLTAEEELKTYSYEHCDITDAGPSGTKKPKIRGQSSSMQKHLRFDEVPTSIPPIEYQSDIEDDDREFYAHRRSIALGETRPRRSPHLDTIEEGDEQNVATKEHRHFWGSGKLKMPKKKAHVSLR